MGSLRGLNIFNKTLLLMPLMFLAVFFFTSMSVYAEQEGDFYYTITNGEATVTGYSWVGGDVTIPETLGGVPVTSVGDKAFCWDNSWWPDKSDIIKSIHIPASVNHIGNNAFYNNRGLKNINLPQGIKSIDDYTFFSCTSLTTLDIPQSVESIGDYAFRGCYGLTNISIPVNTTKIGDYAFDNCGGLVNILIPQNVTSIGFAAFARCYGITAFTVDENNLYYSSRDGLLCNKSGTNLVAWPWNRTEISIPQGVSCIGEGVFSGMTGLTSITIPEGVTRIGTGAFQGCTELKSVGLPQSLKEIDEIAFGSCRGLTTIDLPEGLLNIGINAFSGDSGLKFVTIPESVTSIGSGAFSGCEALTNINIPEGITCIGDTTFSQCKSLTEIIIPESVISIGSGAFSNCNSLKTVNIPKNVTVINSWAFSACWNLSRITLPEGITSIGNNAFNQCYGLSTINLPQTLISIGEEAFSQCAGLTQLTIPEKVQTIGVMAFEWCGNLKSIRFNSPSTRINVTWQSWYVTIPQGVTIIGYDDSEAHKFANSYGNRFVLIGSEEDDATMGAIPQGMMAIVVKDRESRQPLAGATVTLNGEPVTTDSSGFAAFDAALDGMSTLLSITYSGYCDYQTNLKITGGTAEIYYLRKDSEPNSPHVSMINLDDGDNIVDVQRDSKKYVKLNTNDVVQDKDYSVIEMRAQWKGKTPKKYCLAQDGKTIMESANGIFSREALGRVAEPSLPIYAIVEATDGSISKAIQTNILITNVIFSVSSEPAELRLGNKMGMTIPANIPIIGGMETEMGVKSIPGTFSYSVTDGIVKIGFGTGAEEMRDLIESEETWTKYKKILTDIKNKKKTLKALTKEFKLKKTGTTIVKGWEPEGDIVGYVEGTIVDGQLVVTSSTLILKIGASYSQQFQFPSTFPVVIEVGEKLEAELMNEVARVIPESGDLKLNAELTITPALELGAGIGVANVATVIASGKVEMPLLMRFNDNYQKLSLDGSAKITAKALLFEYKIVETPKATWVLWEGYNGKKISSLEGLEAADLTACNIYDTTQYSLMPRDYAANPTEWSGGGGICTESTDYTNQTLKVLQTNIYPNAQPKITVVGDRQVMVWLADNPSRTSANRTMLVSSVYDKTTGTWSAPAAVTDDGTADFYPQIGCDGTNLYVAWQNSKTTFGDEVALTDAAKAGEIAVAKFDAATGTFIGTTTLTSNDTLDTQPQIAVSGDKVGVVWTSNDQNDLFGTTGRNSLFTAQLSGGTWSAPQAVLTDQNAIPSLSSGYVNNTLTAAYTLDSDNDLNTITDRDLYTLGAGQTANRITNDDVLDSNPVFAQFNGTDTLFWYSDGNINYVPTASLSAAPATIFDQKKEGFSDAFTIVNNSAGKTAAIWTQTKDEVTEIYGSLYDNGTWSNDIRISDVGSRVQFPSGILDTAGNFNIAFNRLTINADTSEQSDLCTLNVIPSYNLTMSDPYYEDAKIIPNTAMPVEIDVTNKGALKVDQIKVEVLDGTASNNTQTLSETIQPGETKTITTQVNLPETITKKDYIIKVTPATGDEYDLSDNQKTITLGYTDLALSLQKYNLGEAGGIVIKAQLENLSYVPTDATLKITEDTLDGKVIFTKTLTDVKQGANQFVTFDLDPQTLAFTSDIKQIYVTVTASGEETSTGDNSDFIVLDNPANIAATLDSIAITTPATKLVYRIGEQLDLSDLVVTGTYSDGTIKAETVTADNITGFDNSKAAKDQVLTITIKGKTATYTVQIGDSSERQLGDVDGNGSITAYDALMALQIATNKKSGSEAEITAADVGKNGTVEAYDALKILQYATGKIKSF